MSTKIIFAVLLLLAWPTVNVAQEPTMGGEPMRVLRRHTSYEVRSDGQATMVAELAMQPRNRAAVNVLGQYALDYQEGMTDIEILEAFTLKRDGRRVEVTPDKIVTQVPPAYADRPMYTDMKVKRIIFPDLSIGDQVVVKYKRTWSTPLFPGHFSVGELFPKSRYFEDVRIVLKHPKSNPLLAKARDLKELPAIETEGFITREWRYENRSVVLEEPGAIDQADRDPGLVISSFASYDAIAAAYDARARDKARVTPEIQKLANDITKGIRDKRKQAEALYAWVTKNIRYVAIYLGAGGYVPHTASSILENRYGDCKDYTTILGALLTAKGIDNEPVIIHAGNRYTIPDTPTPGAFNHAITYLPEFNLYLDATARTLPFGHLAPSEVDKFVLHTRTAPNVRKTPGLPDDRSLTTVTTMVMADDGTVKGTSDVRGSRSMEMEMQSMATRLQNTQQAKAFSMSMFSLEGLAGSAEIKVINNTGTNDATARYEASFSLNTWANLPGPGAVAAHSGLLSPYSLKLLSTLSLNSPAAKVDRVCYAGSFNEESEINFPNTVNLTNTPRNVSVANSVGNYQSEYVRNGPKVIISRKLKLNYPDTTCSPAEITAMREIMEAVRRDTAAQITYE